MTVTILPNVESLVSVFLAADPDMAAITGNRWYTDIPTAKTYPLGRVTLAADTKVTQRPLWLVTAVLQIETWGGSQWDATIAALTAQAVLAERLEGIHERGIVTGVRFGPMRNVPDTEFTPAKPRRIFTAQVTAHPTP
jgi:hypothetical protein